MAGPGTQLNGPILSGDKFYADANGPANSGLCLLTQVMPILNVNGTNTVSATIVIPPGSIIHDILADTTVAWNSGTSDTLTIGVSPGDSTYGGGVSVAATGRKGAQTATPIASATQLLAWQTAGITIVATVTPAGTAATTGQTIITIEYIQTVQNLDFLI